MCNNPGTPQQFQAGGPVKTQTLQDQEAGGDPIFDTIAGREFLIGTPGEFKPGIGDIAMGLARSEFDLPDQQVAGFTPDQVDAFDIVREGVGSFQPFLSQATDLTGSGITALEQAREQSLALGAQIPGQVQTGQTALSRAAEDLQRAAQQGGGSADDAAQRILEAAQSSDPATRSAAEELMGSSSRLGQLAGQTRVNLGGVTSAADARLQDATRAGQAAAQGGQAGLAQAGQGALGVAGDAASRSRALQSPLESDLGRATEGAAGAARTGQAGLADAASRARESTASAQRQLMDAAEFGQGTAAMGIRSLQGTTGAFDPSSTRSFMGEFDDAAVSQALQDIARQGTLAQQDVRAQAVGAGAFGGSRQAVAEQELQRNILEQQGRTAAQMRQSGFESASQRAQQAFESQQGRAQQAASLTGQLGQAGAGSALQAAGEAGRLGLSAEQLAQGSAGQAAQLGMSAEQFRSANAQSLAQTGLSIEQLAAQTGLSAQQVAGEFSAQGAQLGMSAADQASRNAAQMAQLGMSAEQIAAQTGLSVEQARQAAAGTAAGLSQSQAQIGMEGAQSAGTMEMAGADMQMQGAMAAGNLGLQGADLGLSGIEAGLGAQQQAAGIGQGIAGLGQQVVGLGQAQQQFTANDANSLLGIGGMGQQLDQAEMDAQRANEFQDVVQPFQNLAFASDIIQGLPSGQTTTQLQPGPSVGSQAVGTLVGAGATAYNALNPQQPEQQFQAGGLVKTQPREAREKLRSMGGIMSSSPQLANTVAKFNVGGPIQSRGLAMPSAPDASLPSAGRARATNVGGRAFVLTDDGRVLDAQTGAPATPEVAAEVRRRLSPPLSMAGIVGAAPDFSGGVNPAFREDTSGQLPPMPSDVGPMSEPATTADPSAPFDMDAFQRDLTGAGRAVVGPGLMAIDDLAYDGPLISPVQPPRTPREDTHSADLRAAIEAAQAGGSSVEAPADGTSFTDALSNRPRMAGETFDSLTGKVGEAFDSLRDKAGEFLPDVSESLGNAAQLGTMLFPGVRLPASEIIEALPETPVLADPAVADTGPVVDTAPPAPTIDVDLNDPDTYDTNFEEMMRRLGGATGKADKSSRQKAMADLAMIGFAIAAGQSPDALTNIAQGALTGMKAIRAEDAATSAADRETRSLAARMASEATNLDREIASRERIAGMNLEGRGDSYAKLLLEQTNKIMQTGQVDIADAMTQAREQLSAAGLSAPLGAEQRVGIQTRVDAARNDPEALAAIRNSLIVRGISPADFGV